jgi:LPS sulfotransferase NodH
MRPDIDFVFIIGAARSGTTWLQAMLAAHESVCSTIDELKLFDFFTVPLERGWKSLVGLQTATGGDPNGLTAVWTEDEFYQFLSELVGRIYTQVLAKMPDATVLLDKAPGYSSHVEHINRLIPKAKFIHIIRDGRDVAASLMAAAQGWGSPWAPKHIEKAAASWRSLVLAARQARQYEDRYLEIRYEELLTNGVEVLSQVFEFMGIPINVQNVTAIYERHQFENMKRTGTGTYGFALPKEFFRKGQAGDWRNSLNFGQRYAFDEIAGDLLGALGYGEASWWYDHEYQRVTVPLAAMLSSQSKMKLKALSTFKRLLGPQWTERIRAVRGRRASEINGLQIRGNH